MRHVQKQTQAGPGSVLYAPELVDQEGELESREVVFLDELERIAQAYERTVRDVRRELERRGSPFYGPRSGIIGLVTVEPVPTEGFLRVSWFDRRGPIGHEHVATFQEAAERLVSDLGDELLPDGGGRILSSWSRSLAWQEGLYAMRRVARWNAGGRHG